MGQVGLKSTGRTGGRRAVRNEDRSRCLVIVGLVKLDDDGSTVPVVRFRHLTLASTCSAAPREGGTLRRLTWIAICSATVLTMGIIGIVVPGQAWARRHHAPRMTSPYMRVCGVQFCFGQQV